MLSRHKLRSLNNFFTRFVNNDSIFEAGNLLLLFVCLRLILQSDRKYQFYDSSSEIDKHWNHQIQLSPRCAALDSQSNSVKILLPFTQNLLQMSIFLLASHKCFVHRVRALTIRGYWITRSNSSFNCRAFTSKRDLTKIICFSEVSNVFGWATKCESAPGAQQLCLSRKGPYTTLALKGMRKKCRELWDLFTLVQHSERN